MSEHQESSIPTIWRVVAGRFIVALIFGSLMSALVSANVALPVPLIEKVRQEGGRLGLYLATMFNDMLSRSGVERPPGTTRITMFDVDETACQSLVGYRKCRFDRIGHAKVIDAALAAADTTKAKVIVFDILFPTAAEAGLPDAQQLLKRIAADGPPIIAPIAYGENSLGAVSVDWANSICGRPVCGRLRFAPAYTLDHIKSARAYPLVIEALIATDSPSDARRPLPSLVMATAQAMHMPPTKVLDPLPIVYSIPSFATLSDPDDMSIFERQLSEYQDSAYYMRVPPAENGQGFKFLERSKEIVLIGSSAPVTEDIHDTPLGPMAGMEVVANAIRSLELSRNRSSHPASIWSVLLLTILSWTILLGTIFVVTRIERQSGRYALAVRLPRGVPLVVNYATIAIFAVILLGFAADVLVKVWEITAQLHDPQTRTGDVDIIFPLLAIFFTTGVELAQRFLKELERGVDWVIDRLTTLVRRRPTA